MKKMLTFTVVAVALLAAGQALASQVTTIELSCVDGSTVANINVEGAIRFTHQTEEAKDGRPFRVIVDILTATHALGANNFMSLPDCPVKSIRTSQYSVKPEAVVRVVFDMAVEQVYRVESDEKHIKLIFADKAGRQFSGWSTSAVVAALSGKASSRADKGKVQAAAPAPSKVLEKSAKELNKEIKQDRLASLKPKATTPGKPVPSKPKKLAVAAPKPASETMPRLSKGEALYGPFVDKSLLDENRPEPLAAATSQPAKTSSVPSSKQLTKAKPQPPAKAEMKKPSPKAGNTASQPVHEKKKTPAQTKPAATGAAKPAMAQKTNGGEKEAAAKKSTSRFRRAPVTSKKIKGTLVAEFPKRLVIKYKAKQRRDPFATLLDESKTNNSPIERRVPNVEGLKLVGVIVAGGKDNRALFEDNENYGYILETGDKVQKGYVLRVESDRVYFQIFEYGWSRTVALHLES